MYNISWRSKPLDEMKERKYTPREEFIMSQHSNMYGGSFDWKLKQPFSYESTELKITSNLCQMFNWAFGVEHWCDAIAGKKGKDIQQPIHNAIRRLNVNKKTAMKMEAPNGWGTYMGALRFLNDLFAESIYYKDCYLCISY